MRCAHVDTNWLCCRQSTLKHNSQRHNATVSADQIGLVLSGSNGEAEEGEGMQQEVNLLVVHHKALGAQRLRAYNGVLSGELRPEVLLLEAVEQRWRHCKTE